MQVRLSRLLAVAVIALVGLPPTSAHAKRWSGDAINVALEIPDEPNPWEWVPHNASFKKYNIVRAARRVLKKYRNSAEAVKGEGAYLDLVARDAKDGETLETVTADKATREWLVGRFKKHGDFEEEESSVAGGEDSVPCRILRVDGEAKNLGGKIGACHGMLLVAVLRKKVYLLRMYAWHTEYDEEGLKSDIDYISTDGLEFPVSRELTEPGKPPPAEDDPAAETDSGADELIWFEDANMEIIRDGRLKSLKITRKEQRDYLVLKLEGNSKMGSYQLWLYSYADTRVENGRQAGPYPIQSGITTTWYGHFLASHPTGTIYKYKWPRKGPFLTMPLLDEANQEVVFDEEKKKRVEKPSIPEIIKKLKIVQRVKKAKIGEHKASEAYRGVLQGLQANVGRVVTLRFAWRGKAHSFRLNVVLARDGDKKFGEPMRKTLESIKIYKKKPKDMDDRLAKQEAARNANGGDKKAGE